MDPLHIASGVLLCLGLFFALTGAVGVWRMPDFYSRLHPAGKSESFAQVLIVVGLCLRADDLLVVGKLAMLSVLLFLTSPTATHAITKAARLDGLLPWVKPGDEEAMASRNIQMNAPGHEPVQPAADTIAVYSRLHALAPQVDPQEDEGDVDSDDDTEASAGE